jgi:ABC-2 type transport system permease protein
MTGPTGSARLRGVPPQQPGAEARATGAAPGYRVGRTLPLRVEFVRQVKRRRTLVMALLLGLLPIVLMVALVVRGHPAGSDATSTSTLMDSATKSGASFTVVCLYLSAGLLLVVPIALFCGDTVASEANWSSLRYLLAAPVPRGRLLLNKALVALAMSAAAVFLLPLVAMVVGGIAYGWGPLRLVNGDALGAGAAVPRIALGVAYVFVSQLVTAALALWLSTKTDAPLGAVGGAVALTIVGSVLDAVTALGSWRVLLPAHWQYNWLDAVQPQLRWDGMIQGSAVSVAYALVLFALAFRGFARKDIVS